MLLAEASQYERAGDGISNEMQLPVILAAGKGLIAAFEDDLDVATVARDGALVGEIGQAVVIEFEARKWFCGPLLGRAGDLEGGQGIGGFEHEVVVGPACGGVLLDDKAACGVGSVVAGWVGGSHGVIIGAQRSKSRGFGGGVGVGGPGSGGGCEASGAGVYLEPLGALEGQ